MNDFSESDPIFLKLGGSLLTDKTEFEQIRQDVLSRVAGEISAARDANPTLRLVLGHGSGSFGHVHASQYGTRIGVQTAAEWAGFTAVSDSALRLNRIVVKALLQAGVLPAWQHGSSVTNSVPPRAAAPACSRA